MCITIRIFMSTRGFNFFGLWVGDGISSNKTYLEMELKEEVKEGFKKVLLAENSRVLSASSEGMIIRPWLG